jgi:hypothetical protein
MRSQCLTSRHQRSGQKGAALRDRQRALRSGYANHGVCDSSPRRQRAGSQRAAAASAIGADDLTAASPTIWPLAKAEFEEKEYEIAMAIELASPGADGALLFACGQVLEEILGYDAAADPDKQHPLWRLLEVPRPRGVRLIPDYWPLDHQPKRDQLPPQPMSFIVQYKRPDYLRGGRAQQWWMWHAPYYRFAVTPSQQSVLKRLEQNVGSDALVRYACPAFWTRGDLDRARMQRTVATESGYISPLALDGHKVWTFISPGVDGRANPRGSHVLFESLAQLFAPLIRGQLGSQELVRSSGLANHLVVLSESARYRQPFLRTQVDKWLRSVEAADLGLSAEQVRLVGAYATVLSLLARLGASWYLTSRPAR